jgi:hypothetical protein
MTLLQMVQLILSSMDSDEVNSINDTVESRQVVDQIEMVYNDIVSTIEFPEHWTLFELQPSGDVTRPTLMYIPDDVAKIEWIQYDFTPSASTERDWRYVFPLSRQMFFDRMNGLDSSRDDVYQFDLLVNSETFDVRGLNNKGPSSYTSIDNRTLLFDSFNSDDGQTLVGNRTKCYGMKIPAFIREDTFVPELEPRQFTMLFNDAKAQCFLDLKQVQNIRAEQKARRGWIHSQKKKATNEAGKIHSDFTPNFGRRGKR